jgi:hypothetical protein
VFGEPRANISEADNRGFHKTTPIELHASRLSRDEATRVAIPLPEAALIRPTVNLPRSKLVPVRFAF